MSMTIKRRKQMPTIGYNLSTVLNIRRLASVHILGQKLLPSSGFLVIELKELVGSIECLPNLEA